MSRANTYMRVWVLNEAMSLDKKRERWEVLPWKTQATGLAIPTPSINVNLIGMKLVLKPRSGREEVLFGRQ